MSGFGAVERVAEDQGQDATGGGAALADENKISLCSIQMGEVVFGIDTTMVREVLGRTDRGSRRGAAAGVQARHGLRQVPLAPAYVAGVIPYRGEVLTTLSLRVLLGEESPEAGGYVLVLDDAETGEIFGLMVDAVNGVVTVRKEMLEANPCTLDARSRALFDGVYKMPTGLIVRIDPVRLSPVRLAASGLLEERGIPGGCGCVR